MTSDKAIEIDVRLRTAIAALKSAQEHLPAEIAEDDITAQEIAEGLEEALQSCITASTLCRSVSC